MAQPETTYGYCSPLKGSAHLGMCVGVCLGWLSIVGGCLEYGILLAWILDSSHEYNYILSRLLPSYSTNAHPCALVRQWCTCDWLEGVEWQTWVSSSHTCVSISNTAQDPPTPLGTLGFSRIPTYHRASSIFVPLLIKHPDSNIVFLLWQVCYVVKSSFSKGFLSLCTQQLLLHFFKMNSLVCSSLWTGENCLTQSLFIWSEKEENHAILYLKLDFPIQLHCLKVGFALPIPCRIWQNAVHRGGSAKPGSASNYSKENAHPQKPTSMQMCII